MIFTSAAYISKNGNSMAILVVQTSWLGDNILTTPLVYNLARADVVDVLTLPAWREVYENNPAVRRILVFDKRGEHRGINGVRRVARLLSGRDYEWAVHPQKWFRNALVTALAKIPRRVGFADAPARMFYTHKVKYPLSEHELVRLLELARTVVGEPEVVPPQLFPTWQNFEHIEKILNKLKRPIVAVAPGSAWATKRYPFYDRVVEILVRRGVNVVCVGTPGEDELIRRVAGTYAEVFISRAILDTAALFKSVDLLVANDSGAGHIGSAVGIPVVSIFGPTVPEQGFAPWGEHNRIVQVPLKCRPCNPHGPEKCPLGHHNCMKKISPEMVVQAVFDLLEN